MKKAKSDQLDPTAEEDALRLAQKIRKLPRHVQTALEPLVDLILAKSKPKTARKDD